MARSCSGIGFFFSRLRALAALAILAAAAGTGVAAAPAERTLVAYEAKYVGTIGDKKVAIDLTRFADRLSGSYFYGGHAGHPIQFSGTLAGNAFDASETLGGKVAGLWHGTLTPGKITGTWTSPDKTRTLPLAAATGAEGKAFPYDIRLVLNAQADPRKIIANQSAADGCDSADADLQVTAIELIDPADGKLVQTLGRDIADVLSQGTCKLFVPLVEDMNFDGWPDLRIARFLPAAPNVPYAAWLFDPATRRLVLNDDLGNLTALDFDPATKRVSTTVRDSCCAYTGETYAWEGRHLVLLTKSETTYLDPAAGPAGETCYIEKDYRRVDARMALAKTARHCDKADASP